ncbi:MAG: RHS repeat-associated core domain-containing protein, partial [Bacteroidota bacterium]
ARVYQQATEGTVFGFNGKMNDSEWGIQNYGLRLYDRKSGRFLSVDPLAASFPWNSSYAFAEGDVIRSIDLDGAEKSIAITYVYEDYNQQVIFDRDIELEAMGIRDVMHNIGLGFIPADADFHLNLIIEARNNQLQLLGGQVMDIANILPEKTFYDRKVAFKEGFESGSKTVLTRLAKIHPGVKAMEIYTGYSMEGKELNDLARGYKVYQLKEFIKSPVKETGKSIGLGLLINVAGYFASKGSEYYGTEMGMLNSQLAVDILSANVSEQTAYSNFSKGYEELMGTGFMYSMYQLSSGAVTLYEALEGSEVNGSDIYEKYKQYGDKFNQLPKINLRDREIKRNDDVLFKF